MNKNTNKNVVKNILTCERHKKNLLVWYTSEGYFMSVWIFCFEAAEKRKIKECYTKPTFHFSSKGEHKNEKQIILYIIHVVMGREQTIITTITCVFACVKSKNNHHSHPQQNKPYSSWFNSFLFSLSLYMPAQSQHMLVCSTLTIHIPKPIAVCLRVFACSSRH